MGCAPSVSADYDAQVKSGNLTHDCFDEQRALGKGGFGTVLCVCKKFGPKEDREKLYAMKRLDKRRIVDCWGMDVMLMAELHYMIDITTDRSQVAGDFLMQLECAFQDKCHVYIVQNLMEGGDVFHLLKKRNAPLSLAEVKWFTACTCLALQQLHDHHNILHRDIKEENLLIDSKGYAHIADFGLSDKMDSMGQSHASGGTMAYMSPESRDTSTKRTQKKTHDFFAVGVMVFRMLTCEFPFDCSHNFNTVIAMHINKKTAALEHSASSDLKIMRNEEILLEAHEMPERYKINKVLLYNKVKDKNVIDFVLELLVFKEELRLGKRRGVSELMAHPFLKGTDWESMRSKKALAPYVPDPNDMAEIMRNDLDLFESFRQDDADDQIPEEKQQMFRDFYFNPWVVDESNNATDSVSMGKSVRTTLDHEKVKNLRDKHLEEHEKTVRKGPAKKEGGMDAVHEEEE